MLDAFYIDSSSSGPARYKQSWLRRVDLAVLIEYSERTISFGCRICHGQRIVTTAQGPPDEARMSKCNGVEALQLVEEGKRQQSRACHARDTQEATKGGLLLTCTKESAAACEM